MVSSLVNSAKQCSAKRWFVSVMFDIFVRLFFLVDIVKSKPSIRTGKIRIYTVPVIVAMSTNDMVTICNLRHTGVAANVAVLSLGFWRRRHCPPHSPSHHCFAILGEFLPKHLFWEDGIRQSLGYRPTSVSCYHIVYHIRSFGKTGFRHQFGKIHKIRPHITGHGSRFGYSGSTRTFGRILYLGSGIPKHTWRTLSDTYMCVDFESSIKFTTGAKKNRYSNFP